MVATDEIVSLFKGDDLSFGYNHQELIVELCSRTVAGCTPTVEWVISVLYPGVEVSAMEPEIMGVVTSGVKLWYRRNRPRR